MGVTRPRKKGENRPPPPRRKFQEGPPLPGPLKITFLKALFNGEKQPI